MNRSRFGIAFRLLAGLASLVLLTAGAIGVSLLAFRTYNNALDQIGHEKLPALVSSAALVQLTQKLVATAPALMLTETQYERRSLMLRIDGQTAAIDEQLANLRKFGLTSDEAAAISQIESDLVEGLRQLDLAVGQRIDHEHHLQDLNQEIRQIRSQVHALDASHLAAGGADRLKEMLTSGKLPGPDAASLWDQEISLHDWLGLSDGVQTLLMSAEDAQNKGALNSIKVQLLDLFDRMTPPAQRLPADERTAIDAILAKSRSLALDDDGLLAARMAQLETSRNEQTALSSNRLLADRLVSAVTGPQDKLTESALQLGAAADTDALHAVERLAVIVAVCLLLAGATLVYINRSVIRRLARLQTTMRAHVEGEPGPIDLSGNDEIAEIAHAFAFFVAAISEREAALKESKAEVERALADLKAAQASLIHAEKLASLGQLTAGIAHEIKNPLNFVNNFAALSLELFEELATAMQAGESGEVTELADLIAGNLGKIRDHGKRADGIVRSMLLHSRESDHRHEPFELNELVEEALNLAFHGAKVQEPGFITRVERHLAPDLGAAEMVPQDIMRVFLNLFSNAFYATTKRRSAEGSAFQPIITITTRAVESTVEIEIADNGVGMTEEVRAKLFTPFFTTKPTGEGTGLGLSLSYDIIVHEHGGKIAVESRPDDHTVVTVTLPRRAAGSGALAASAAAAG